MVYASIITQIGLDHWATFLVSFIIIITTGYKIHQSLKKRICKNMVKVEKELYYLKKAVDNIEQNQIKLNIALESFHKLKLDLEFEPKPEE